MAGWKPSTGQKIEKLYAWIATEEDGGEGVCTAISNGNWFPLLGADRERVESQRPMAETVCRELGLAVTLKVFGTGVVIDKIEPPK